jgi:ABC-type multidrug transport system permease subunit
MKRRRRRGDKMWARIRESMFSPSVTFRASKDEKFGDALKYYLTLLAIFSLLFGVVTAVILLSPPVQGIIRSMSTGVYPTELFSLTIPNVAMLGVVLFISTFIAGIIAIFVLGIWLHIWAYAFGGRRGLAETIKALIYSSTPLLILGWIPGVNIIGVIWAVLLVLVGLIEFQEMYSGRSILALLAALLVPLAIIGAIAAGAPAILSYQIVFSYASLP